MRISIIRSLLICIAHWSWCSLTVDVNCCTKHNIPASYSQVARQFQNLARTTALTTSYHRVSLCDVWRYIIWAAGSVVSRPELIKIIPSRYNHMPKNNSSFFVKYSPNKNKVPNISCLPHRDLFMAIRAKCFFARACVLCVRACVCVCACARARVYVEVCSIKII